MASPARVSTSSSVIPDLERRIRELTTLVDVLRARARTSPEHRLLTFVEDGSGVERHVSCAELDRDARRIAAWLQSSGAVGQPVIIALAPGALYNRALWGCLYAGAIAVPVYPAYSPLTARRLAAIAADSDARIALTDAPLNEVRKRLAQHAPSLAHLRWLEVDRVADGTEHLWRETSFRRDDLALLQYTSGSTGEPKGVMISHHNLYANLLTMLRGAERVCEIDFASTDRHGADRGLSWLPPYHDMGLTSMLAPVIGGGHSFQFSPMWFVRRPERWIQTISDERIAICAAPNFAFDMAVERAALLGNSQLDLSCWRVAVVGAEPVRQHTLERFSSVFERHGFRPESFRPSYGMAEATLLVTSSDRREHSVFCHVRRDAFAEDRVELEPEASAAPLSIAGNGWAQGEQIVLVVDPEHCSPCAPNRVGEIWIRGPNVALGYHQKPELTQATFGAMVVDPPEGIPVGPYLRTGDKGFWHAGHLFIAGRLKDTLVIRGRNYYANDLEETAGRSSELLLPRGGAAFAVNDADEERVVLVHEVASKRADASTLGDRVQAAILREHGIRLSELVLIARHSLPRTSSGKTQRAATRTAYLEGQLSVVQARRWTVR